MHQLNVSFTLAFGCGLAALALGCGQTAVEDGEQRDGGQIMLDPEQARAALVHLVKESSDEVLLVGLAQLENAPVDRLGAVAQIGHWQCDLNEGSFVLTLVSERGFYELSGRFHVGPDGTWHARVVRKRQT